MSEDAQRIGDQVDPGLVRSAAEHRDTVDAELSIGAVLVAVCGFGGYREAPRLPSP